MEIRVLNSAQLTEIYYNHMIYDFPENELKSLKQLITSYQRKDMVVLGLYDIELVGYALIYNYDDIYLLDYFAILRSYRNNGYGKLFLHKILDRFNDSLFFLECEVNIDNDIMKAKRINFYLNNGLYDSKLRVELFDVKFHVFTNRSIADIKMIDKMYRYIYRKVYDDKVKYY